MNFPDFPNYSVTELNQAIGNLINKAFAPRFYVHATVSKAQLKKGHLWLTLTDGKASITAVVWASSLNKITFQPKEEDGVNIMGKLNFWESRASLVIQVIDIRPTISTILRKFEVVSQLLIKEGLISDERRKRLPPYPNSIAILTSVPSSALADMLRTAKERWPLTKLLVCSIPVQGSVSQKIIDVLDLLEQNHFVLGIDAIILARGGGSREDLSVFDDEDLCRKLAGFPLPVITGLGHEDDLTVADLVADHRSATPTASIVDLLPSKEIAIDYCKQIRQRLNEYSSWIIRKERQSISQRSNTLSDNSPIECIRRYRNVLNQRKQILSAFSPERLFSKGFCILRDDLGKTIRSVKDVATQDLLSIQLIDGEIDSIVQTIHLNQKSRGKKEL